MHVSLRSMLFLRSSKLLACFLVVLFMAQCSAVQTIPERDGRPVGYLRLEIDPPEAEVEIDERYSGRIDGWMAQTVPVEPGLRRVTIRAEGYITQRFDISVAAGEEVTLELKMEPSFQEEASPRTRRTPVRRHDER